MLKLILSVIVVVGGLVAAIWKRYLTRDAKIRRLKQKRQEIRNEMEKYRVDSAAWVFRRLECERLSKEIYNLRS